ncbi:MAG TPA: carbon-nitrogen hydrolase family protein [Nocardioides sp.]|uniref:carbon-nitrogen hydrolase family protein n=1 Tax=Nocardioides sp. TaxID=35761 RepID=UPI002ED97176
MTLRVAAVQAEAAPGEVEHNVAAAAGWIRAAADSGAELVVFPEAFTTGYSPAAFAGTLPSADDLGWLAPAQAAVEATGTVALLNTPLRDGRSAALVQLVLRPGASPEPAYAKQHLYAEERRWFTAGDHGTTLVVDGTRVGLSVCYDANFPEHAAAAAADGATAYLNSGAYFPGGAARRDLHYAARALDNGIYVVFAGLLGAPYDFIGGAGVWDPEGRLVARAPEGVEGLTVADLDPARVAEVRASQRMWADRRADLGPRRELR